MMHQKIRLNWFFFFPGWVTSSTERPLSIAAAIMLDCVRNAACACPSSTRRLAWPRTTATSGWSVTIVGQVGINIMTSERS